MSDLAKVAFHSEKVASHAQHSRSVRRLDLALVVSIDMPFAESFRDNQGHFAENLKTVFVEYSSFGWRIVEGKLGWLGLSG